MHERGIYIVRDGRRLFLELFDGDTWQMLGDPSGWREPGGEIVAGPWPDEDALCQELLKGRQKQADESGG